MKRPGAEAAMRSHNDSAIRRARKAAKDRGHRLADGQVADSTRNHAMLWYAWCPCGAAAVVEDGYQPRGSAIANDCQLDVIRKIPVQQPDQESIALVLQSLRGLVDQCGAMRTFEINSALQSIVRRLDRAYGAPPCKACEGRTEAGFEGQCPACVNERSRPHVEVP